jgi:hypothetical protein
MAKSLRQRRASVRAALRDAHDTYRRVSQVPAPLPVPAPPVRAPAVAPRRGAGVRARAGAAADRLAEWRAARGGADADAPDVLLDVPSLSLDELQLEVDDLKARVALEARVLDLVQLDVGADVSLGAVKLDIKGVEAQALLKVRLENLRQIVERVMDTVDRNPEILEGLTRRLGGTLEELSRGTGQAVGALGALGAQAAQAAGGGGGRENGKAPAGA